MCYVIVGLDLSGVEHRPTGFCVLRDMKAELCQLYSNADIIKRTLKAKPSVVAIDAPLYMPPGRTSLNERNGNHLRESDRALLKMGIKIIPPTLGPMRQLTTRGIQLRLLFQQKGLQVIEAYPGGAQDILAIPRKKQGIDKLKAGLVQLGIEGLAEINSDHELDAATCAYIGKLFLEENIDVYGNPDEGIILPKRKKYCGS